MKVISSNQLKNLETHSLQVVSGQALVKGKLDNSLIKFKMDATAALKSVSAYNLETLLNAAVDDVMNKVGHPEATSKKDYKYNWGKLIISATRQWLSSPMYQMNGRQQGQEDWEANVLEATITKVTVPTVKKWLDQGQDMQHIKANILFLIKGYMSDLLRSLKTARRGYDKKSENEGKTFTYKNTLDKQSGDGKEDSSYMDYLQFISENEPGISRQQSQAIEKDFFNKLDAFIKRKARVPAIYAVYKLSLPPHEMDTVQIAQALKRRGMDLTPATISNYLKEIRDYIYIWAKQNKDTYLTNNINRLYTDPKTNKLFTKDR